MLEKARVWWNCSQTSTLSNGWIGYGQPWRDSVDELLRFDAKDEGTTLWVCASPFDVLTDSMQARPWRTTRMTVSVSIRGRRWRTARTTLSVSMRRQRWREDQEPHPKPTKRPKLLLMQRWWTGGSESFAWFESIVFERFYYDCIRCLYYIDLICTDCKPRQF